MELEPKIKWTRQAVRRGGSCTVTLPPEIVSALEIENGDELEITVDGHTVQIVKKAVP